MCMVQGILPTVFLTLVTSRVGCCLVQDETMCFICITFITFLLVLLFFLCVFVRKLAIGCALERSV